MKIGDGIKVIFSGEYQTPCGDYINVTSFIDDVAEITAALDAAFGYSNYNQRWAQRKVDNLVAIKEAENKAVSDAERKAAAAKFDARRVLATFSQDKYKKYAYVDGYEFIMDSYTGVYICRLSPEECEVAVEKYGISDLYSSIGVAVTNMGKYNGFVEHRTYQAWILPVIGEEVLKFGNGIQSS